MEYNFSYNIMQTLVTVKSCNISYMNTITERINKIINESGLNQSEAARYIGASPQAIRKWESGESIDIKGKNLFMLAKLGNTTMEWIQTGKKPLSINEQRGIYQSNLVETGTIDREYKTVPVVGMAKLGDNGYFEEMDYPTGHGDGYIDTPTKDQNAYGLKVVGDSMYPAIRHGWYVVIEPNLEIYNGILALFKFKDGRKMIKELANYSDSYYTLLSVNEEHKRITASAEEIEDIHPVAFIAPPNKVKNP